VGSRAHHTQRLVLRSSIVLSLGEGLSARAVARALRVSRHTVDLWRSLYETGGCEALERDKPAGGANLSRRAEAITSRWPSYFSFSWSNERWVRLRAGLVS
jgi:transposase